MTWAKRTSPRPRQRRGFTIVEMIVVMLMLVILAGMAVPSFIKSIREERLKSSTRIVISVLRIARSRAVNHATPVRVNFDMAEGDISLTELYDDQEEASLYGESVSSFTGSAFEEREWLPIETRMTRDRGLPEQISIAYVGVRPDQEDPERDAMREEEFGTRSELDYVEFYPDGSAEDTYIILRNEVESEMTIHLDGITADPKILSDDEAQRLALVGERYQ